MKKEEIYNYLEENANSSTLSFSQRGPWGSSKYRGNCSGWIPASLIYRYDCKSVSEIFAGSGTTSDLCKDLEIPYVGIDLNPNPVRDDIISMDIMDESMELPDGFYESDLQFLHPPYPSINGIHYSGSMWKDDRNLANKDIQEMSWEKGMNAINRAVMRGYAAMPAGSYQAIVVGDIRRRVDGKSVFRSMLSELVQAGELQQVLIKMQHNTVSGRSSNYSYGKRNFFLIEHEYVVVYKKPSGYEIAYVVPKKYSFDIRDSKCATWKDVVFTVLQNISEEASLNEIYAALEGHKKTQTNPHWKDKIRQVLQMLEKSGLAVHSAYGRWAAA